MNSPLDENTSPNHRGRKRGSISGRPSLAGAVFSPKGSPSAIVQAQAHELESWKERVRLAGEMGKALLLANDSLKSEKESYRSQLQIARATISENSKALCDMADESEDLRTRNRMLMEHLTTLEASNARLARELEDATKRHEVPEAEVQQEKAREHSDAEALLVQLAEQERHSASLALQLSRLRVDHDRVTEQLRVVQEEQVPALERDSQKLTAMESEREALERKSAALEAANQELVSTVQTLQYLHTGNEREWRPVAAALVAQPEFLAGAGASEAFNGAAAELRAIVAAESVPRAADDMVRFLCEQLPQPVRWLVCSSVWRAEHARKSQEVAQLSHELERLRDELEDAERRGVRSPMAAVSSPLGNVLGSPLVVLQQEQRQQQRDAELMEQWNGERQQLLALLSAKDGELVQARGGLESEIARLSSALGAAQTEAMHLRVELDAVRSSQDHTLRLRHLEAQLAERAMLLDETRRRLAEMQVQNAALRDGWQRVERAVDPVQGVLALEQSRRVSLDVACANQPPRGQRAPADHGTAAARAAEQTVVARVVALERDLKTVAFQKERFEHMYRASTMRLEALLQQSDETIAALRQQVETLTADLHAMETVPVAEDLTMELFFSFALAVKLSLAASDHPAAKLNRNVHELYEEMQRQQWTIDQWPTRVHNFFMMEDK